MKLWASNFLSGVKNVEDLVKRLSSLFKNLGLLLKNNVTFTDNIKCQVVDFFFENANDTYQVNHNLGVVPIGVFVIRQNTTGELYWPTVPEWTNKSIFVAHSSNDTNARIIIIGA